MVSIIIYISLLLIIAIFLLFLHSTIPTTKNSSNIVNKQELNNIDKIIMLIKR